MKRQKDIGGENNDVQMKIRPVIFDTSSERTRSIYISRETKESFHTLIRFIRFRKKSISNSSKGVQNDRSFERTKARAFFFPKIVNACCMCVCSTCMCTYVRAYMCNASVHTCMCMYVCVHVKAMLTDCKSTNDFC